MLDAALAPSGTRVARAISDESSLQAFEVVNVDTRKSEHTARLDASGREDEGRLATTTRLADVGADARLFSPR